MERTAFEGWRITNSSALLENKSTRELAKEMFGKEIPLEGVLEKSFLNFNIYTDHWENLLKFRFRLRSSRVRPVTLCFFLKHPPRDPWMLLMLLTWSRQVCDHAGGSGEWVSRDILEAKNMFVVSFQLGKPVNKAPWVHCHVSETRRWDGVPCKHRMNLGVRGREDEGMLAQQRKSRIIRRM